MTTNQILKAIAFIGIPCLVIGIISGMALCYAMMNAVNDAEKKGNQQWDDLHHPLK